MQTKQIAHGSADLRWTNDALFAATDKAAYKIGFATALQTTLAQSDVPDTVKEELQKIVEWSLHHADYVDPLTDLKWVAEQFKKPSWMFG